MAEDQDFNGNLWTAQASILLQKLGWLKVADSNIDIPGSNGFVHGIDALFRYEDGFNHPVQGVFLEAKRYATSSFREAKLQDWVNVLHKKIVELRSSAPFNTTYPMMSETDPRNGLLVLWFHDLNNYRAFKPTLTSALAAVQTPRGRGVTSRLFVLSNDDILRLASLVRTIEIWNSATTDVAGSNLQFYYPSSLGYGSSTRQTPILNLEYMFSRFIVARGTEYEGRTENKAYIVFYFGNLDMASFSNLRSALLTHNMLADEKSSLHLYHYQRNDEFRKIQSDVERMFQSDTKTVIIRSMEIFYDLPSWMHDIN